MAQQEARRDIDVELGDALPGALDIPLRKGLRAFAQGVVALPALQQVFVEGEEDAFSIQLECGKPVALTDDVRWCEVLASSALKPFEHHDFFKFVDCDQTGDTAHHATRRATPASSVRPSAFQSWVWCSVTKSSSSLRSGISPISARYSSARRSPAVIVRPNRG